MVVLQDLAVGVAAAIGVVLFLTLISIDAVEQTQYGLVFNWVTKSFKEEVYHGGTHFIGFWNKFVVFPATIQTIEFGNRRPGQEMLHTRTKEGLGLHLGISFQYLLDPERLHELYSLTNVNYEMLFTRVARDQLLEAASEYEGPQYWLERQRIGDHMRGLVNTELHKHCAALWGLQLLDIDLPDRYEESITLTQVQQQMMKTRRNEQEAARIRADTEVLTADFARLILVTQSGAQANFTLKTLSAKAEAARKKITMEAETLGYVRQKLKLSPIHAVEYQELAAYNDLVNATFLANLPKATAVVGAGGLAAGGGGAAGAALVQQSGGDSKAQEAAGRPAGPKSFLATGAVDVASATTRPPAEQKILEFFDKERV
mmetsp:Transcript_14276/g.42565  ORF Transcript_14276/g.42565 Transcript_14276/m.42565 type:complete len:373 (+) Transcript_14276:81-1199(+)